MFKKISFLLSMLSTLVGIESHAVTFVQLISNDTQANAYRGLQVGIRVDPAEGSTTPKWGARVRFADKEEQVCSGTTPLPWLNCIVGVIGGVGIQRLAGMPFLQDWRKTVGLVIAGVGLPLAYHFLNQSLGYWDSKVFIRTSNNHAGKKDNHLIVSQQNDIIDKQEKTVLCEWRLDSDMSEEDFFGRINSMRTAENGPFPFYTLSGVGARKDGINCVSFVVRLGHLLGVPFRTDEQLAFYTDKENRANLPWTWKKKAATPEVILLTILKNSQWKEEGSSLIIKRGHSFWGTMNWDHILDGHPKVVRAH